MISDRRRIISPDAHCCIATDREITAEQLLTGRERLGLVGLLLDTRLRHQLADGLLEVIDATPLKAPNRSAERTIRISHGSRWRRAVHHRLERMQRSADHLIN
jgi:hypothetical protein